MERRYFITHFGAEKVISPFRGTYQTFWLVKKKPMKKKFFFSKKTRKQGFLHRIMKEKIGGRKIFSLMFFSLSLWPPYPSPPHALSKKKWLLVEGVASIPPSRVGYQSIELHEKPLTPKPQTHNPPPSLFPSKNPPDCRKKRENLRVFGPGSSPDGFTRPGMVGGIRNLYPSIEN